MKTIKKNEDIFSVLKAEHRKIDALFAKIEKTTERGTKVREKLYSQLRMELGSHALSEEKAVYPYLKEESLTEEIAYESVEEHAVMKSLLEKLDGTACESKEWIAQITVLKEVVRHHVKEEESEMFKRMRKAFPQEELRAMAVDFLEIKQSLLEQGREEMAEAA